MKKNFRFMAMAVVAMAATVFTGCSSDDDFLTPMKKVRFKPAQHLTPMERLPSRLMILPLR